MMAKTLAAISDASMQTPDGIASIQNPLVRPFRRRLSGEIANTVGFPSTAYLNRDAET